MKNKLVLGLISLVLLLSQSMVIAEVSSSQELDASGFPACSAEFVPPSGSRYAEGMVTVDHSDPQDCDMNHMSSAS